MLSLDIQSKLWISSQNSLIDFDSDKAISFSSTVSFSGYLHFKDNVFNLLPTDESNIGTPALLKIKRGKEIYELELSASSLTSDVEETTWILFHNYIQNNNEDFGYKIREGDSFKFGKFILKIRHLNLKKDNLIKTMIENKSKTFKEEDDDLSRHFIFPKEISNAKLIHNNSVNDLFMSNNKMDPFLLLSKKENKSKQIKDNTEDKEEYNSNNKPSCRICLCEEYDDINPLINPCKCSGTMKYIHLNCLRQLIKSKISEKIGENVSMFTFKSLECELCQNIFPETIKIKEKRYSIIDLHRPSGNYILLEGIIKESPEIKTIYLITITEGKPIKIGRSSDSDLRLGDISVSRSHAKLVFNNGSIYLYDTKSKFGSLIKAHKNIVVLPNRVCLLNKGKLCLGFRMKLQFCAFLSCYKPKIKYKTENDYYDEQLEQNAHNDYSIPNFLCIKTLTVSQFESFEEINKSIPQIISKEE